MKIEPIGIVRVVSIEETRIEVSAEYHQCLRGIACGVHLDVLYWMHKLDPVQRNLRQVHPRGDKERPLQGVFSLRSPMRPNPIGVSVVRVVRLEKGNLYVTPFDAEDGSPVIDIKASRERLP